MTVSGEKTATPGEDYSFNVTAKDSSVSVREVKVELATGAEELNQVNGSETTLLSATTAPNVNTIGVDAEQDSNLPVENAYKYTLNYSHENSSSGTSSVYRRISNVNLTQGKPNAFSFSFWISKDSLTTLNENALDIWFSYVDALAQGLKVSLLLKTSVTKSEPLSLWRRYMSLAIAISIFRPAITRQCALKSKAIGTGSA